MNGPTFERRAISGFVDTIIVSTLSSTIRDSLAGL